MKVTITYQGITQNLSLKPEATINYLRVLVQESFKKLPNDFLLRECKTNKQIQNQEELSKMMEIQEHEIAFQVVQNVNAQVETQLNKIDIKRKQQDPNQIISVCDESDEFHKNIEQDYSKHIQKLFPGILNHLSQRKSNASEINENKMLHHFFKLMTKRYNTLKENICKKYTSLQELIEHEQYLNKIITQLQNLVTGKNKINTLLEECKIIKEFEGTLNDMNKFHLQCQQTLKKIIESFPKEKQQLLKEFQQEKEELRRMIDCCEKQIKQVQCEQNIEKHQEMAKKCCTLLKNLEKSLDKAEKYKFAEKKLSVEIKDYTYLERWMKQMSIYACFWGCAHQWKICSVKWMSCPLNEIKANQIQDQIKKCCLDVARVRTNQYENKLISLCNTLECCIEDVKNFLPLIKVLSSPSMTEKYFIEISSKISIKLTPSAPLSFLFEKNMKNHQEYCQEVCQKAQNDFKFLSILEEIEKCWKKMSIQIDKENEKFPKMTNTDELMNAVDKHQIQLNNLKPYFCYEKYLACWQQKERIMMDTLENMNKVQNIWMYHSQIWCDIFIRKRIPLIEEEFKPVCSLWKEICHSAEKSPLAIDTLCSEDCRQKVSLVCEKIERMQKATYSFLDDRRADFPRLQLLSNETVLDLLRNPDPKYACRYLKSIFENVREPVIENGCIIGLVSHEMETLPLVTGVSTTNRHPEEWLKELQSIMKSSVHNQMKKTLQKQWSCEMIKTNLSQCVLACSQLHWTDTTEAAIISKALNEHYKKCEKQLVEQVKLLKASLTKNERNVLHSLITLNVHANEIVNSLVRQGVDSADSFKWICFARTYHNGITCEVRCMDHCVPHFGEFLGNTMRLVMTPLTDRAYMSMMTALRLGLGSAPAGPAGTGKTETVKDLAKMVWQCCSVMNCSDQFDYLVCAKILRGITSCGIWCCFDEFNRIPVEVLSAVAIQLQTIFTARDAKQDTFTICGKQTRMIPSFNITMSMNPGYAGRTQLPEQYKNLFRPISFIVPDMHLIAEIKFYSMGIVEASSLAKKMANLLDTCKEQLTPQAHYDFGMRKMMMIIRQMQTICEKGPQMTPTQILANALRMSMVPMMSSEDLTVFESILKDYCPDQIDKQEPHCLNHLIPLCCEKLKIQPNRKFNEKVCQLYDTMNYRHGLMLVGQSGVGKTCIQKTLALAKQCYDQACITRHIISPKSMRYSDLFGNFTNETWKDGILSDIMRTCSKEVGKDMHWIKFDGPVDPEWVETLNAVLDDNKALLLPNEDRINLTANMRVIFEVDNNETSTPAFISRVGVVSVPPTTFDIHSVIGSWLQGLPASISSREKTMSNIQNLLGEFLLPCVNYVIDECSLVLPTVAMPHLLQQFLKLFRCQLNYCCQHDFLEEVEQYVTELFSWCLVWSMGCMVTSQCRGNFDVFLKGIFKQKMREFFPSQTNVFDVRFCLYSHEWMKWETTIEENSSQFLCHRIVPTTEMTRNMFVMNMLMSEGRPVLLAGPMCTGKTTICLQVLAQLPSTWHSNTLKFSPSTEVNYVQNMLNKELQGSSKGKLVVCIDDMNMAPRTNYGDQPVNEWIKMCLENNFWYDRETFTKRKCQYVMFCANMTSGQNFYNMCPRVLRQFNVISCPEVSENTLSQIFSSTICHWLGEQPENIRLFSSKMTQACVQICTFSKSYPMFVPLQQCSSFILRDAVKMIHGISSASSSSITSPTDMMKLIQHQNMRVFQDRLSTRQQQKRYNEKTIEIVNECFEREEYTLCERIVFADYMQNITNTNKAYDEVKNFNDFLSRSEFYTEKLCEGAYMTAEICESIAKICRVLRQPKGHCLVLGPKGSGRRMYSKMASYFMNCEVQEVNIGENQSYNKWKSELKSIIFKGIEGNKRCSVLFRDCHFTGDMVSDLCSIMKVENIQHYLTPQDEKHLMSCCEVECKKKNISTTQNNLIKVCQERIMKNIHFVLCLNPEDPEFQRWVKKYPHLLCETTISWICQWPDESLMSMAAKVLCLKDKNINEEVPEACMRIHQSFEAERSTLSTNEYITTHYENLYFDFLRTFKTQCKKEMLRYDEDKARMQKFLIKLSQCMKNMLQLRKQIRTVQFSVEVSFKLESLEKMMEKIEQVQKFWNQDLKSLEKSRKKIQGNCILRAAVITYCPPMSNECRIRMKERWEQELNNCGVPYSHNMEECRQLNWCLDTWWKDNLMMMQRGQKLPIFVDPDHQMKKNLSKLTGRNEQLCTVAANHPNLVGEVETSLRNGKWVLIEAINNKILPYLINLVCSLPPAQRCKMVLSTSEVSPNFDSPQMRELVLINNSMTAKRVESELLHQIMSIDHSHVQENMLRAQNLYTDCMAEKKKSEEMLLDCLCSSKGSLINDEPFINALTSVITHSDQLHHTYKTYCTLRRQYQQIRNRYRLFTSFASMVYSCAQQLVDINPMYHISFDWFLELYGECARKCPASLVTCNKMTAINHTFTQKLFTCVCRQIFPEHRMIFACILACKAMENDYSITREEVSCFVSWANDSFPVPANPTKWISQLQWSVAYTELKRLSSLGRFPSIHDHFLTNHRQWQQLHSCMPCLDKFPHPFNHLNAFHKLMIVKVLFPQQLVSCMHDFVREALGEFFCRPVDYDFTTMFRQSRCEAPILVISKEGLMDSFNEEIRRCSGENGMGESLEVLCLTQGNVKKVFRDIKTSSIDKKWVVIENCHEHIGCLPDLLQLWSEIQPTCHKDFRLWLRCLPITRFPTQLLDTCMRVCWRPDTSCPTILRSIFSRLEESDFQQCSQPQVLMRLFYACCMLHCVVMERNNYESIGWKMNYFFVPDDLMCCFKEIRQVLDSYKVVPFDRLQYIISEIFYGGRINECRDRQLMMALTKMFIHEQALLPSYPFTSTRHFPQLQDCKWSTLMSTIDSLPPMTAADLCLSATANTIHSHNLFYNSINTLQKMGIMRRKEIWRVERLECMLPECLNMKEVKKRFPVSHDNPMNFCLMQECQAYNAILCKVRMDLGRMRKCLGKQEFMDEQTERRIGWIQQNRVPAQWRKFGPSLPLNVWIVSLQKRVQYFHTWVNHRPPFCFDLSMFVKPQAVFTACLQNLSRKHAKSIQSLSFHIKFIHMQANISNMPDEGFYVKGLSVEGACWSFDKAQLIEPNPEETYSSLPVMHLLPNLKEKPDEAGTYNCPVYHWLPRRGTLDIPRGNTFIRSLELPTTLTAEQCVRNGVAAFVS